MEPVADRSRFDRPDKLTVVRRDAVQTLQRRDR